MRISLGLAALVLSGSAFAQTHEQVLSTLGAPMPAHSVFCNGQSSAASATTCTAGPGVTISGNTISASGGGANPAGASYSVQINNNGTLAGTGPGSAGQCLVSNGPTGAPTYQPCTASGAVGSVTAGGTGLLSVSPTSGSVVADIANLAGYTVIGNPSASTGAASAASMHQLQGALTAVNETTISASPSAGPLNDYNPAGFGSTVAVLQLTPNPGNSTLNGLVAGSAMQAVFIANTEAVGSSDFIILTNESSSDSTPANRFHASGNLYIPPGGRVFCVYISARWSCQ